MNKQVCWHDGMLWLSCSVHFKWTAIYISRCVCIHISRACTLPVRQIKHQCRLEIYTRHSYIFANIVALHTQLAKGMPIWPTKYIATQYDAQAFINVSVFWYPLHRRANWKAMQVSAYTEILRNKIAGEKKRLSYRLNEIFKQCMHFMHAIDVLI